MVLAEVDSGDDSTDSDLDSESTDNESELTDITMPSIASSTSSGRTVIMRPRAQDEYFFNQINVCFFQKNSLILHCLNCLRLYKGWGEGVT